MYKNKNVGTPIRKMCQYMCGDKIKIIKSLDGKHII